MTAGELGQLDELVLDVEELIDTLAAQIGFSGATLPCMRAGLVGGILALQKACDCLAVVRLHIEQHLMDDETFEDSEKIERDARQQRAQVAIAVASHEQIGELHGQIPGDSVDLRNALDVPSPRARRNARRAGRTHD